MNILKDKFSILICCLEKELQEKVKKREKIKEKIGQIYEEHDDLLKEGQVLGNVLRDLSQKVARKNSYSQNKLKNGFEKKGLYFGCLLLLIGFMLLLFLLGTLSLWLGGFYLLIAGVFSGKLRGVLNSLKDKICQEEKDLDAEYQMLNSFQLEEELQRAEQAARQVILDIRTLEYEDALLCGELQDSEREINALEQKILLLKEKFFEAFRKKEDEQLTSEVDAFYEEVMVVDENDDNEKGLCLKRQNPNES